MDALLTTSSTALYLGFPLYAVIFDPATGHVVASGGGGPSRSGIGNGFVRLPFVSYVLQVVLRIVKRDAVWQIVKVGELSTETEAVMSLAFEPNKVCALFLYGDSR